MQHTFLILIGTYETRFQDDLFQIEFIVKCATAAKIGGCTDCLGICITKWYQILYKESPENFVVVRLLDERGKYNLEDTFCV